MSLKKSFPSRFKGIFVELGIAAAYLVGAIVFTYPLILDLPEAVTDLADPLLNSWTLAWVIHQLPRSPLHLFDANIFFPESGTLAFSEHLLGVALLVAPVQVVFQQAVATHNVALLLSIALSGYGLFRLVRWLTGSAAAAWVAGSLFAYAPYRLGHLSHLQLQAAGFIPLVFVCLSRYLDEGRPRQALGVAIFVWFTSASCGYYGIFTWIMLAVAIPYELLRSGAVRCPRRTVGLAFALLLSALAYLPLAVPYMRLGRDFGFHRPLERVETGSARPKSYVRSQAPLHQFLGLPAGNPEKSLFPGLTVLILGSIALYKLNRRSGLYLLLGGFAFWASLGPSAGLYRWLHGLVPGVSGLRVPARFSIYVFFALSVLAGFAVNALLSRRGSRVRIACAVGLAVAPLAESIHRPLHFRPAPVQPPPVYAWLASQPGPTPILELPMPHTRRKTHDNTVYMLWSTHHFKPMVNGHSGFVPRSYYQLADALQTLATRPDIEAIRSRRIRYIVFHRDRYLRRRAGMIERALDSEPALKKVYSGENESVYEVLQESNIDRTTFRQRSRQ